MGQSGVLDRRSTGDVRRLCRVMVRSCGQPVRVAGIRRQLANAGGIGDHADRSVAGRRAPGSTCRGNHPRVWLAAIPVAHEPGVSLGDKRTRTDPRRIDTRPFLEARRSLSHNALSRCCSFHVLNLTSEALRVVKGYSRGGSHRRCAAQWRHSRTQGLDESITSVPAQTTQVADVPVFDSTFAQRVNSVTNVLG